MNNENGNGDSNGNGQKVFQLARVKSPEEVQQESSRKIAPEVRTAVWNSKLPMAAKGFFAMLLDLSFLYSFGGNGRGKIFITTRDLSRFSKHDKDSVAEWRRILVDAGLVWYDEGWPRSEWRITPLCPAPEPTEGRPEEVFIAGKASALAASGNLPPANFLARNGHPPRNTEGTGGFERQESPTLAEGSGQTVGNLPPRGGSLSVNSGGKVRSDCPTPSARVGESGSNHCPVPSASVTDKPLTDKESPMESGSRETMECVPDGAGHTPVVRFEPLDLKMVPRLRRVNGEKMIERFKEKIYGLENNRRPPENRKAIVQAYKGRIRDIKDWMDGVLPEPAGKAVGK